MPDDLRKLLLERENLETALKVSEAVDKIKREIQREFWEKVRSLLKGKLSGISHWHVVEDGPDRKTLWRPVVISQKRRNAICKNQFSVMCERQEKGGSHFGYGVNRGCKKGRDVQHVSESESKLKAILADAGAVETPWWPRYYDLTKRESSWFYESSALCESSNLCDHILKLKEDNSNPDHPLAQRLCDWIWGVFEKTREQLELLNANYPYAE